MTVRHDPLGDRMKGYERPETDRRPGVGDLVAVRVDGMSFSSFTRDMPKPYDRQLGNLMIETARYLVERMGASVAYTQSDEITLIFADASPLPFAGRLHKLASAAAAIATSRFVQGALLHWPAKCQRTPPAFDGRAFTLPNRDEAAAVLIWRELDAARNAVSMAAQALYSQRELQGLPTEQILEKLAGSPIRFSDYPVHFRRGRYLGRRSMLAELGGDELVRIPTARRPEGPVMRRRVVELEIPPVGTLLNPADVLLDGAEPVERPFGGVKAIRNGEDLASALGEIAVLQYAIAATPPESRRLELEWLVAGYRASAA